MNVAGVTEAEEAVAVVNGHLISVENVASAGKGGYEHHEGGFRQVKIRDQGIHHLEVITGIDEDRGVVRTGLHDAILIRS